MVFCIDVRSEIPRRYIETINPKIETLGFAGFFGLPLDYVRIKEKQAQHRLPVPLCPSLKVHEEPQDNQNTDLKNTLFQNGLFALLTSPIIRKGLKEASIDIPDSTWFVAAVHETVTDEIFILDRSDIPEQFQSKIQTLEKNLKQASKNCQNERQTARSKRSSVDPMKRAKNWSEVRPEWALAGNAAFIVAPRERTYGVNLNSRVFLHNYDWMKDEKRGFQTLELIMTAPMIVTSWINLQYYASTVAPQIYSSGNKVLHNLVNESGVFEGNGGDLRVGLPLQSLHDGHRWIHDPLRLSVFIEAPKDSIESVIKKHKVVKDLLSNEWLHIIQIDSSQHSFFRRTRHGNYTSI